MGNSFSTENLKKGIKDFGEVGKELNAAAVNVTGQDLRGLTGELTSLGKTYGKEALRLHASTTTDPNKKKSIEMLLNIDDAVEARRMRLQQGAPELPSREENLTEGSLEDNIEGSGESDSLNVYGGLMSHYQEKYGDKWGSGCGCFTGAAEESYAEDLKNYGESINSLTKTQLVDDIVDLMSTMGIKVSGESREEKVKSILDSIPNSKKNKKSFKNDAEVHKKLCVAVGQKINQKYGRNIIDTNAAPAVICQTVAEIIHSLQHGLQIEFVAAHAEIKRALQNMVILKSFLDKIHNEIEGRLEKIQDPVVQEKTVLRRDVYKMLSKELDRQISILRNILEVNVVSAETNVRQLLASDPEYKMFNELEHILPGTSAFGERVAAILAEIGITASLANIVDGALKKLGISMREFAESKDMRDIMTKINTKLLEAQVDDTELENLLKSVDIIYKNFYRRKDIESAMQQSNKSVEGGDGAYIVEGEEQLSRLDRRVRNKRALRNLLFKVFDKQLNEQYRLFVYNLNVLSKKLGQEIPVGEPIENLRNILVKIRPFLMRPKTYVALIGYFNDAYSKEIRDTFLAQLKMLQSGIETILESQKYKGTEAQFKDLMDSVKSLTNSVEQYTDKVAEKFGKSETTGQGEDKIKEEDFEDNETCVYIEGRGGEMLSEDELNPKQGSADDFIKGLAGFPDPAIQRMFVSVGDAITRFDYYYQASQVRENLKQIGGEFKHYSENYVNIRAVSIADKINKIKDDTEAILADLKNMIKYPFLNKDKGVYTKEVLEFGVEVSARTVKNVADAKIKLWRTVETIDEYLRLFTENMVVNPEDARKIKSMLNDLDLIYDWYFDETGADLHRAFDSLLANKAANGKSIETNPEYVNSPKSKHYYMILSDLLQKGVNPLSSNMPGNPFIGISPLDDQKLFDTSKKELKSKEFLHKSLMSFFALKNIINIFATIGNKFGSGSNLSNDIYLSPAQIYKNLFDYIETSAYCVGADYFGIKFNIRDNKKFEIIAEKDPTGRAITTMGSKRNIPEFITKYKEDFEKAKFMLEMNNDIEAKKKVADALGSVLGIVKVIEVLEDVLPQADKFAADLDVPPSNDVQIAQGVIQKYISDYKTAINEFLSLKDSIKTRVKEVMDNLKILSKNEINRVLSSLYEYIARLRSNLTPLVDDTQIYIVNRPASFNLDGANQLKRFKERITDLAKLPIQYFGEKFEGAYVTSFEQLPSISLIPVEKGYYYVAAVLYYIAKYGLLGEDVNFDDMKEITESIIPPTQAYDSGTPDIFYLGPAAQGGFDPNKPNMREFNRNFNIYMRGVIPVLNSCFEEEDQYFVHCIKGICSKIFVYLGTNELMDRPYEMSTFSSNRIILGADDEVPKVETDATELYLRLVLLAVFYRNLFRFDPNGPGFEANSDTGVEEKISLLPDVEGKFSGLINLIFKKYKDYSIENFTDVEVYDIIKEINLIYTKSQPKNGMTLVRTVIQEFVDEINKRYGIIKKKDIETYLQDFGQRYEYATQMGYRPGEDMGRPEYINDIPLLPGEDKLEYEVPALPPSAQYEKSTLSLDSKRAKLKYKILESHYKLFYNFRCKIDSFFTKNISEQSWISDGVNEEGEKNVTVFKDNKDISFRPAIKAAINKLKMEQNNLERVKIISQLIRGIDILNRTEQHRYLLFHETVVTGLNAITSIAKILEKFKSTVLVLHAIAKNKTIVDIMRTYYNAGFDATVGSAFAREQPAMINLYKAMNDLYTKCTAGTAEENNKNILNAIISVLSNLFNDNQKLIEIRFTDQININFSGLKKLVLDTFENVKYFGNLLRPIIRKDLFNRYFYKFEPGSFYYLYEQLVEKIIMGRPAAKVGDVKYIEYINLENLSKLFNEVVTNFAKPAAGKGFDQAISEHLFYNAPNTCTSVYNNDGPLSGFGANKAPQAISDFNDPMDNLFRFNFGNGYVVYPHLMNRFKQLYTWDSTSYNANNGLVLQFNQFLAKYLSAFFDRANNKFYVNLLGNFVNGPMNESILNQKLTFPDLVPGLSKINVEQFTEEYENSTQEPTIQQPPPVKDLSFNKDQALNAPNSDTVKNVILTSKNWIFKTNFTKIKKTNNNNYEYQMKLTDQYSAMIDDSSKNKDMDLKSLQNPQCNNILFTTLSLVIKNIYSSKNAASQIPIYLAENISDVPSFMKEKYKCNLPVFRMIFKQMHNRADLIKNLISMSRISFNLERTVKADKKINWVVDGSNMLDESTSIIGVNSAVMTKYYVNLADCIMKACSSVISSIDTVMRELNDDPKYFELGPGFITEYKNTNKKDPFMPISNALNVLRLDLDGTKIPKSQYKLLPGHNIGSTMFKYLYGLRGLVYRPELPITGENMPGLNQICDLYNLTVDNREKADKSEADKFLQNYVKIIRFSSEMLSYRSWLYDHKTANQNLFHNTENMTDLSLVKMTGVAGYYFGQNISFIPFGLNEGANLNNKGRFREKNIKPVYPLFVSDVDKIISAIESPKKEEKVTEYVDYIAENKPEAADDIEVRNIIDLNIVPINVHAMMRDIPLVNLYNYSYNFDRSVIELFFGGIASNFTTTLINSLCSVGGSLPYDLPLNKNLINYKSDTTGPRKHLVKDPSDLLAMLLINPYKFIPFEWYDEVLQAHYSGNNKLGRAKFITDQLFGKLLFQNPIWLESSTGQPFGNKMKNADKYLFYPNRSPEYDLKSDVDVFSTYEGEYNKPARVASEQNLLKAKAAQIGNNKNAIDNLQGRFGYLRFQTTIVRNLMFVTNIQRMLLYKLRKEVEYDKEVITSGTGVLRRDLTELERRQSLWPSHRDYDTDYEIYNTY